MPTRRQFLAATGAAALAGPLLAQTQPTTRAAENPMKILILGGTGFLGPKQVEHALARGHSVTIANRGRTRPELFDEREKVDELVIDREGDMSELEQAVAGGRRWDAVIDNVAYVPAHVERACEILKDAADLYLMVSTVSVYGNGVSKPNADESYPVATVSDEQANAVTTIREVGSLYGPLKARCEDAARATFGEERACIPRPGLIAGPGDPTDRFSYWPVRAGMAERCGGRMLVPGSAAEPMELQIIDVRDLAQFCITSCEQATSGTFNLVAPTTDLKAVYDAAAKSHENAAAAEWVAVDYLSNAGVGWWSELPAVVPAEGDYAGFASLSNAAAVAAGLTCRPVGETVTSLLDWWKGLPAERTAQLRAGLSEEREQALLTAWADAQ